MAVYSIQKNQSKEENPYSIWRLDGILIEDDLSYGQAIYWAYREMDKFVEMGRLTKANAVAMRGDINAYNDFISAFVQAG